jgi:prophage antirepressor-like protein
LFTKQYKGKGVNASYYTLHIMDIIRAFTTNTMHTEIVIKGTVEAPLFRASDVALILEISNIRASIKDFNESEKIVQTMTTPGGPQKVSFLTHTGLFRLLFRSKNPIALQVQYWACDVVKELQINQRKKNDMMKLQESIESENSSLNQIHAPNDELVQMELENEKLKSALEITKKNQNGLIQELVKTVQHLSSQMERFEKINKELCEKINTMDPFSKRPEAN